ncbi:hypothetical protein Poli38472_013252 [Pythium oligandrum]|uniref:Uncharacterized protein n=1 Tax=Pythium oligandrum TaxID=41045 RepID=A0A8K1C2P9_PYTOL|nr:hypothetical protein Poli38472_013252 [Pythium oligandrum]|eukprot:TMW55361.1 hypothetical protein Poli38472_013252 [Pythium oligandrum]
MADASESSTESEYYDEDVKAEQVKVEKTEVKDTSTGHSPESNSLVESAFPLSAPTQFVSPFAALAQTPPLASASGKSVSTEYTALSRSKQLKLQTADLVAEHKTLKLTVIAHCKNSLLVEKAFNKLVKIPVLPSGRSWDDIGKNPAHRAMIKRMRNMKRAEQRYNTKNSNAAKRKPLPPAKTLALTQELVDLDRLTIQTLTEQIINWVYHLQQEDVQLSKEAEALVAKYKRDKGSETALEELVEELERECETVGVRANPEMPDEAITGLTCERQHRRRYQVTAMKYVKMYRSVLDRAGVKVPSEIAQLCEDETLQARIQRYETASDRVKA